MKLKKKTKKRRKIKRLLFVTLFLTAMVFSGLYLLSEKGSEMFNQTSADTLDSVNLQALTSTISNKNISKENLTNQWDFFIEEDTKKEVNISIKEISKDILEVTLNNHPESTTKAGYKWNMALCNITSNGKLKYQNEDSVGGFKNAIYINATYGKLTDFGMNETWCGGGDGYVLFSSGSKNQFPKKIRIDVSNITEFTLYAGSGSITIHATEGAVRLTNPVTAESICTDINGKLHVAWEGDGNDLWYANSTDDGTTWTSRSIKDSSSMGGVSVTCSPNGNLTVSYVESNRLKLKYSEDDGASFSSDIFVDSGCCTNNDGPYSVAVDSNNILHYCEVDNLDNTDYINTSTFTPIEIRGADSDACSIEVNSTNVPHIAITMDAGDDVLVMSSINGWTTTDTVFDGVSMNAQESATITFDSNDMGKIAFTDADDLWYCNGTFSNTWTCLEVIPATTVFFPEIVNTLKDDSFITYTNGTDASSNGYVRYANSTDGATWDTGGVIIGGRANYPNVAQSTFPSSNNVSDLLRIVFMDGTGGSNGPSFVNLTVPVSAGGDTTAPVITLPVYTNGTKKLNTDTLTLNVSVIDADSSSDSCNVNINGTNQTFVVDAGDWCNFTVGNLTSLSDGNKTILVYANDTLNNWGLNNSFVVEIDTTSPVISLPVYTNGTKKLNTEKLTLNISISDANADYCFINVNGTNQTFVVDSNNWCNTTNGNLTSLSDGNRTINIYANDTLGSLALNNSFVVEIDTTTPTITLPVYTNATLKKNTESLTLNISITDTNPDSCIVEINGTNQSFKIDSNNWCNTTNGNLTSLSDGNVTMNIYSNDTLGSLGLNNSFVVQIDTTVPLLDVVFPANTTNQSSSTVVFSGTCTDNNLNYCVLYGDWSGTWSVNATNSTPINNTQTNFTVTGIPEGEHFFAYWSNDTLGNEAFGLNRTFTIDSTNTISSFGINPLNNSNESSSSVTFDFKATDNVVVSSINLYGNWSNGTTEIWNLNYSNISYTNNTWLNITVDGISDGIYVWGIFSNDTVGNNDFTNTNRTFIVDTIVPTITLPVYTNATSKRTTQTLTLNISVTDVNAEYCIININGTNQSFKIDSNNWCNTTNGNLTSLSDGNIIMNIYANDTAGNLGLNNSFVVNIFSNSITISTLGSTTATAYSVSESACVDPNGKLHVAWEDSGDDLWYANSTDDGTTWVTRKIYIGTVSTVSTICSPDGNVTVSYIESGDLDMFYSGDSGVTWNGPVTIEDDRGIIQAVGPYADAVDSNNVIHWCYIDNTGGAVSYVNSSDIDNATQFRTEDADHCDIEVNSTDAVHILVADTTDNNITLYSSLDDFSTFDTVVEADGLISANVWDAPTLKIDSNNKISIGYVSDNDLWYCNGTFSNAWTCTEIIGATTVYFPTIAVTLKKDIFISYTDTTNLTNSHISYANTTDKISWDIGTALLDGNPLTVSYNTFLQSTFPTSNNASNLLRSIHTANDQEGGQLVVFSNITVPVASTPIDSCTATSPTWSIDLADNCVITDEQSSSTTLVVVTGIGSLTIDGGIIVCNAFHFTPTTLNGSSIFSKINGGRLSCFI